VTTAPGGARLLGFSAAITWMLLAGWIALIAAGLVGVGIDPSRTPLIGWLGGTVLATVVVAAGFWLWPTLVLSGAAALLLMSDIAAALPGAGDATGGLRATIALAAAVAAISWSALIVHIRQ
jgi:hypothetical protein